MTRKEFDAFLQDNHLENEVSFAPNLKDGLCVRKSQLRWEVFVLERGMEYDSVGFPSEEDALNYVDQELNKYILWQKKKAKHTKSDS